MTIPLLPSGGLAALWWGPVCPGAMIRSGRRSGGRNCNISVRTSSCATTERRRWPPCWTPTAIGIAQRTRALEIARSARGAVLHGLIDLYELTYSFFVRPKSAVGALDPGGPSSAITGYLLFGQ